MAVRGPTPGQIEDDFLKWCAIHPEWHIRVFNQAAPEESVAAREGAYSKALYKGRPKDDTERDEWYTALSQFQRDLLNRAKNRKRREEYRKSEAMKGRVVKPRRPPLTEEQSREARRLKQQRRRERERAKAAGATPTAATQAPRTPTPPEVTLPAQRVAESPPAASVVQSKELEKVRREHAAMRAQFEAAKAAQTTVTPKPPVFFGDDDILPDEILAELDRAEAAQLQVTPAHAAPVIGMPDDVADALKELDSALPKQEAPADPPPAGHGELDITLEDLGDVGLPVSNLPGAQRRLIAEIDALAADYATHDGQE